ncbi:MAG: tetratricopeptide repeat protein [Verrucomicrobiales bacterium]|nr:tetratricopeptide repeat protein [Verrucomicrobiales bacterium]
MKNPTNAEFAQFRFVRNAEGNVIPLPAQGIDEKNLLVLDCERWGMARLHIFEGAAVREDKLEAFQDELRRIADIRSDSVSRLITWGRDSEELFYADEMQDGEPLPEYLDRAGGVPFPVAGEWMTQLFEFLEQVPRGLPSFDRFTTLNFQVVVDRYHEVRPVFSEFYGWTKPGAQVQEHPREWYLAQIFCSLIAGVPVRTFYRESLPRNFEELTPSVQGAVLDALSESGGRTYDQLKVEMQSLAAEASNYRSSVSLPRLLVREWMDRDLSDSYQGEADFAFQAFENRESERYAVPSVIRGKPSLVQVLPGTESLPREGWLNQHHDATRRPGRSMLHQLQVNYLEDRSSLTLVGEEQIDGTDLSTLLLQLGPHSIDEAAPLIQRVSTALTSLEQNTGSCAVWWLPPENVLFVTGTNSVIGSVHLAERKGSSVWDQWGVKLRLHQTSETLRDGVNLPRPVRLLSRIHGKNFQEARRSAIALPLIFFVLTCHRFRWRRSVESQADLPGRVCDLLERYRSLLLENPESVETNLFEEYLKSDFREASIPAEANPNDETVRDDGFESVLEETLYREPIKLIEPTGPMRAAENSENIDEYLDEPEWDEEDYEGEESLNPTRFLQGWWLALWSVIAALIVGYLFAGWNSRLGDYKEFKDIRFPVTDYEVPEAPNPDEVVAQLESYLVAQAQPDLLPHTKELGIPESRGLIDKFLVKRISEGDGAAARLNALLVGLDGAPMAEVLYSFAEAARLGDSKAQFDLAVIVLIKGLGKLDQSEVRKLLDRSAKTANADARELRGVLLVEESPREARQLMEAASKQNHLGALYHLGLFGANGVGGEVDPEMAAEKFESAATQGEVRSMFALGRCYEIGFGKSADFTEATRWIKMAAALGNQGALAWCQAREIEVTSGEQSADSTGLDQ